MSKQLPDLELLKKRYTYDPESGDVTSVKTGKSIRNKQGRYYRVKVNQQYYLLHRIIYFIMTGEDPSDLCVDHINGNTLDNSWSNLRLCDSSQNQWNRAAVGFTCRPSGFQVQIQQHGITQYVGTFPTEEEAQAAYDSAVQARSETYNRCSASIDS